MNERIAIGIDLGGTFIKAGLINESGQTLGSWKEPTNARKGAKVVMEGLLGITRRILDSEPFQQSKAKNAVLAGIGIGSPGAIDFRTGTVRRATGNLPGWTGTPIGPIFEKEFRVRTWVDNDANAYTLGEYLFGAGRSRKPQVMIGLTLGTGVGGGVIIDGQVQHGAHGFAGELGHIALSDRQDAPPCSTGIRGCLESYACGPAISQYAEEQKKNYPDSLVFQLAQGRPLNTEIIHHAVLQGDPLALHVIDRTATYLGWGLASLVNCYDPDLVVVGGGVANFGEALLERVRRVVQERVYFFEATNLEIVLAQLGGEDGYKGAAGLALFSRD
jgi:glucokinase